MNQDTGHAPARAGTWRHRFDAFVTVVMLAASCALLISLWPLAASPNKNRTVTPPQRAVLPKTPLALTDAARLGDSKAPIAIVEYSDFQCPYCGVFARKTLPGFFREYVETGKVLFVFRHLPLERIHPLAIAEAEAAACAGEQSQFWEMHHQLFAIQEHLDAEALSSQPATLSLDNPQFRSCMSDHRLLPAIRSDMNSARTLGISGTPILFLGPNVDGVTLRAKVVLRGALPLVDLKTTVNKLLSDLVGVGK